MGDEEKKAFTFLVLTTLSVSFSLWLWRDFKKKFIGSLGRETASWRALKDLRDEHWSKFWQTRDWVSSLEQNLELLSRQHWERFFELSSPVMRDALVLSLLFPADLIWVADVLDVSPARLDWLLAEGAHTLGSIHAS